MNYLPVYLHKEFDFFLKKKKNKTKKHAFLLYPPKIKQAAKLALPCNYLWVVHEPHQAPLLCIQYEVTPQELATAFILLDVQKATDAVLSVHIRHLAAGTFPGLLRPGMEKEELGQAKLGSP